MLYAAGWRARSALHGTRQGHKTLPRRASKRPREKDTHSILRYRNEVFRTTWRFSRQSSYMQLELESSNKPRSVLYRYTSTWKPVMPSMLHDNTVCWAMKCCKVRNSVCDLRLNTHWTRMPDIVHENWRRPSAGIKGRQGILRPELLNDEQARKRLFRILIPRSTKDRLCMLWSL